jgi:sporulation protein YlmC with PRC-barrel domain
MRWYLLLILSLGVAVMSACSHVSAAPAVTAPLPATLSTEALTNYQVMSKDGVDIGTVDGVIISTKTGGAQYVVVYIKDIYNFGKGATNGPEDQYLLIPWSHLKLAASTHTLVIDAGASFIGAAPVLYERPDTAVDGWDKSIASYWPE